MSNTHPQKILEHIKGCRQEMGSFLRELVVAESPSTEPESQRRILSILENALQETGYRTHLINGSHSGGHLYARSNTRAHCQAIQLLIGHCDTVWPLGTLEQMPAETEGGMMRGPGVFDMKGGLTQMIFALRTMKALDLTPAVSPVVLINSDEEIGSKESTTYIRRLSRLADRAFILEPSLGLSGKIKTSRKGTGRFTVQIKGKSAHAGLDPDSGASAIVELSHVIQKVHALNDPERGVTLNVGLIEGGLRANVIAPESRAVIDVRVRTPQDAEQIEKALLNLRPTTPGTTVIIEGGTGRPPMEETPRNRVLWEIAKSAGQSLGLDLEEAASGGGSDGNTSSLFTATLDGLGAVGDGAHAQHEFIFLDKMVERASLLTLLLLAPPVNGSTVKGPKRPADFKPRGLL